MWHPEIFIRLYFFSIPTASSEKFDPSYFDGLNKFQRIGRPIWRKPTWHPTFKRTQEILDIYN